MSRPNILWIMADELRASALGCYGCQPGPVAERRKLATSLLHTY